MQENNFETIISTWRRLSVEPVESTTSGEIQVLCMAQQTDNELLPIHCVTKKKVKKIKFFCHKTSGFYDLFLSSMSGDTSDRQTFKKKEETDLLVSERTKLPAVPSEGLSSDTGNSEEKQEFLKQNSDESKEAGGDSHEKDETSDYLENKSSLNKAPDATWEKDKSGDKVDSVYLHPPPPHKARSTASTEEDEDCGIKCLYYTLVCCDCVLM